MANERQNHTKFIRVVRILATVCCYYTYTYSILIPPIFEYSDAFAPSNLSILGLSTAKAKAKANDIIDTDIEQDCDVLLPAAEPPKAWMIPEGIKFGRLDRLKLLKQHQTTTRKNSNFNQKNDNGNDDENDDDNVKIATKAIGLNFADIFTVLGLYSAANIVRQQQKQKRDNNNNDKGNNNDSSFIPGLEFAGTIIADPTGTYQRYDRVCGFTRFGAYADIVSVPPTYLLPLPDHWSYAQGAGFIVQALTAWHGLVEIGRMPLLTSTENTNNTNDRPFIVIVHSAAGGVGLWASEIAARRGAIVLGIIGDKNKEQFFYNRIKHISSDSTVMIRGKERDFRYRLAQKLKEMHSSTTATTTANVTHTPPPLRACDDDDDALLDLLEMSKRGYGADIVMESLGGEYFRSSFDSLNDGGAIVTFGSSSYSTPGRGGFNIIRLIYRYITRPKIDPGDLVSRNIRLSGFNLIFLTERTIQLRKELNECISCLSGRNVNAPVTEDINSNIDEDMTLDLVSPPLIGDTFDFRNEAVDAMEKLKGGKTAGKVVLINNSNNVGSI